MALLKKRPQLVFTSFEEIVGGETLEGELIVKVDEPVPIDWLNVNFEGIEWAAIGSGDSRRTKRVHLCHLQASLAGEQELDVGTHRFPFTIPLPVGLPPTFTSPGAKTTYTLRARASIPWWPDAKLSREILVAASAAAAPHPGDPMVLATRPEGPDGTAPYAEVSFSQRVFAPGDTVRGAVALRNVDHHRYRKVEIELIRHQLTTIGNRKRKSKETGLRFALDTSDAGENEQLPFTIRLDSPLAPTASSQMWSINWTLKVSADVAWKFDPVVEVDVPIVEGRYRALSRARAAPSVGEQRLEECWQEVATARGLELIGAGLRGASGRTSISVWRERTESGARLVGKISYPSLGLGLALQPAGGFFSGAGRRGVLIDDRRWDKAHEVEARSIEQCAEFLFALKPEILELGGLSMNDEELNFSKPGSGNRAVDLLDFVKPLQELADKIEARRSSIAPPPSAARALPAWRELADTLDGTVNAASLSISGRFNGHPVEVAAAWSADGEPVEITAELELGRDVDPAFELEIEPKLLPTLPEALPAGARDLVASLAGVASRLEIRGDTITSACQWLADPRHVLGVLRTLSELAALIAPQGGPFR